MKKRERMDSKMMKHSVLIVDDERVICEGFARLLSDQYIIYQAFNGQEAINTLRINRDIDVMLCDLKMPGMEGIKMIEKVRATNKDIHMIVITALGSPEKVCDAMKKGANNFMLKPVNIPELETNIKNAIKNKKSVAGNMICN